MACKRNLIKDKYRSYSLDASDRYACQVTVDKAQQLHRTPYPGPHRSVVVTSGTIV